ncbi:MAG: WYL domain-containing protein, partial [Bacteroidota bacterium]
AYKGLKWIEPIHKATRERQAITITYQSFKATKPGEIFFHPYLLKEYNNRWFVLGAQETAERLIILALDRIQKIENRNPNDFVRPIIHVEEYFNDVIGVSKSYNHRPRTITLKILKSQIQYILTKPIHPTQTILEEDGDWVHFSLHVIWNYELEREILGKGEIIEVISPKRLRNKILKRLKATSALYEDMDNV